MVLKLYFGGMLFNISVSLNLDSWVFDVSLFSTFYSKCRVNSLLPSLNGITIGINLEAMDFNINDGKESLN